MKKLSCLIGWILLMTTLPGHATSLELGGYQDEQGAITVTFQGNHVDPYFATRALLTARDAGLDIEQPARAWIGWLLRRQEPNGLFKRFCRIEKSAWHGCKEADADDALLAMWLELLHVMAPANGLPLEWRNSAKLASLQLQRLVDKKTGIYQVSATTQVGLFMDNVEIYAALRSISTEQKRLHTTSAAQATFTQSVQLRRKIARVFRPSGSGPFLVSTQPVEARRFYPEEVAQIYPWLYRMTTDRIDPRSAFRVWLQAYGNEWLNQKKDHYPWGLVALTAQNVGDAPTALCWLERAAALRYSDRWNVLEESVFQSIHRADQNNDIPCQSQNKS